MICKALIVGFGSIGQRHAKVLSELKCQVAVVSRRDSGYPKHYFDLREAIKNFEPDYVVIANKTSEHYSELATLTECCFRGKVLVEKPVFERVLTFPPHGFSKLSVAYNLRFHPLLLKLKSLLEKEKKIISATIYAGSFLPSWRQNNDYRKSYSAKRSQGGGVLRDLSHELDYVTWLFGAWKRLTALGGKISHLEIDSDDVFTLLMENERCPLLSIHVNYLDRVPSRSILVNTDQHTIRVDFIGKTISIDEVIELVPCEMAQTYYAEHQAMLKGDVKGLCTLEEGVEVLKIIEAAEKAALCKIWIERSKQDLQ